MCHPPAHGFARDLDPNKTEAGKARISAASLKHGKFTNEAIAERRALTKELKALQSRTEQLKPE